MTEAIQLGQYCQLKDHDIVGRVTAKVIYINREMELRFEWIRTDGGISSKWVQNSELSLVEGHGK